MAVTTNPNAVFISYSGIGNETVKKFIAMLDEKRIPHRDSESEFIQDELTDFEEKIGMANIIVIFYSPDYFKKEHCMNEYANIRKCENKERKAATYYVKCENFKFADILKELKREWGGNFAEWKDEKHENLKPITQLSMANGCYIDENTPYCVQKLDNYFSKKIRFTESNLQDLVVLIEKKYCKLSSKKTPVIQEIPIVAAPHFTFSVPDGLMQREDEVQQTKPLLARHNEDILEDQ
ncbi:MAG: toll/interleukin-1 receptor domain-containing protein [Bacteroidales bacterium]|nr:toll/interleukin-1 receptor domain-containing protein [Bacteroidales bacterium]